MAKILTPEMEEHVKKALDIVRSAKRPGDAAHNSLDYIRKNIPVEYQNAAFRKFSIEVKRTIPNQ